MGTWLDFLNRAYIRPNALRDRIRRQDTYEAEGVSAGRQGKTREDCPYNEATESEAWNFWVYGCENAGGELAAIQAGEVNVALYTTGASSYKQQPIMMPIADAVRTGQWKPHYFGTDEVLRMVGAKELNGSGTPVPTVSGGIAIIGGDDDDESDLRGC